MAKSHGASGITKSADVATIKTINSHLVQEALEKDVDTFGKEWKTLKQIADIFETKGTAIASRSIPRALDAGYIEMLIFRIYGRDGRIVNVKHFRVKNPDCASSEKRQWMGALMPQTRGLEEYSSDSGWLSISELAEELGCCEAWALEQVKKLAKNGLYEIRKFIVSPETAKCRISTKYRPAKSM